MAHAVSQTDSEGVPAVPIAFTEEGKLVIATTDQHADPQPVTLAWAQRHRDIILRERALATEQRRLADESAWSLALARSVAHALPSVTRRLIEGGEPRVIVALGGQPRAAIACVLFDEEARETPSVSLEPIQAAWHALGGGGVPSPDVLVDTWALIGDTWEAALEIDKQGPPLTDLPSQETLRTVWFGVARAVTLLEAVTAESLSRVQYTHPAMSRLVPATTVPSSIRGIRDGWPNRGMTYFYLEVADMPTLVQGWFALADSGSLNTLGQQAWDAACDPGTREAGPCTWRAVHPFSTGHRHSLFRSHAQLGDDPDCVRRVGESLLAGPPADRNSPPAEWSSSVWALVLSVMPVLSAAAACQHHLADEGELRNHLVRYASILLRLVDTRSETVSDWPSTDLTSFFTEARDAARNRWFHMSQLLASEPQKEEAGVRSPNRSEAGKQRDDRIETDHKHNEDDECGKRDEQRSGGSGSLRGSTGDTAPSSRSDTGSASSSKASEELAQIRVAMDNLAAEVQRLSQHNPREPRTPPSPAGQGRRRTLFAHAPATRAPATTTTPAMVPPLAPVGFASPHANPLRRMALGETAATDDELVRALWRKCKELNIMRADEKPGHSDYERELASARIVVELIPSNYTSISRVDVKLLSEYKRKQAFKQGQDHIKRLRDMLTTVSNLKSNSHAEELKDVHAGLDKAFGYQRMLTRLQGIIDGHTTSMLAGLHVPVHPEQHEEYFAAMIALGKAINDYTLRMLVAATPDSQARTAHGTQPYTYVWEYTRALDQEYEQRDSIKRSAAVNALRHSVQPSPHGVDAPRESITHWLRVQNNLRDAREVLKAFFQIEDLTCKEQAVDMYVGTFHPKVFLELQTRQADDLTALPFADRPAKIDAMIQSRVDQLTSLAEAMPAPAATSAAMLAQQANSGGRQGRGNQSRTKDQICFSFRDTNTCHFGSACRFSHDPSHSGGAGAGTQGGGAGGAGGATSRRGDACPGWKAGQCKGGPLTKCKHGYHHYSNVCHLHLLGKCTYKAKCSRMHLAVKPMEDATHRGTRFRRWKEHTDAKKGFWQLGLQQYLSSVPQPVQDAVRAVVCDAWFNGTACAGSCGKQHLSKGDVSLIVATAGTSSSVTLNDF